MRHNTSHGNDACTPGIDGALEGSNICCFVIAVAVGRILGDDLVNGDAAPIADIEIANKLKPGFEALFPGIEDSISAVLLQAAVVRHTAHIAEREGHSCHAGGAE